MDDHVGPEMACFLRETVRYLTHVAEIYPEEQVQVEVRRLTCQVNLFAKEVSQRMCQTKIQAEKLTMWLEVSILSIYSLEMSFPSLLCSKNKLRNVTFHCRKDLGRWTPQLDRSRSFHGGDDMNMFVEAILCHSIYMHCWCLFE